MAHRTPTSPDPPRCPTWRCGERGDAIDWYGTVFGAVVEGEPFENDDGSIGHVALRIADGVIYLADEAPAYGAVAPTGPGRRGEPDAAGARRRHHPRRGRARGGRCPTTVGVYEGYGSRNAWFVDPFGHRWGISSPHG